MLRLFFYDLTRSFARTERSLKVTARDAVMPVPPALRSDVGLNDARMADLVQDQFRSDRDARRSHDAQCLLEIVNAISERRGFPRIHWRGQAEP